MKKKTIILTILSALTLFLFAGTITLASNTNSISDTKEYPYQNRFQGKTKHMNNYQDHCHNNDNFSKNNHHQSRFR